MTPPTPSRAVRITAESQPQYPCWLYGPHAILLTELVWYHAETSHQIFPGALFFHPDQPERPTERPDETLEKVVTNPGSSRPALQAEIVPDADRVIPDNPVLKTEHSAPHLPEEVREGINSAGLAAGLMAWQRQNLIAALAPLWAKKDHVTVTVRRETPPTELAVREGTPRVDTALEYNRGNTNGALLHVARILECELAETKALLDQARAEVVQLKAHQEIMQRTADTQEAAYRAAMKHSDNLKNQFSALHSAPTLRFNAPDQLKKDLSWAIAHCGDSVEKTVEEVLGVLEMHKLVPSAPTSDAVRKAAEEKMLHVADEIEGQVRVGTLKGEQFNTRSYWMQLAGVAREAARHCGGGGEDGARWDWLEKQWKPRFYLKGGEWGFIAGEGTVLITGAGPTLRAAIDAARRPEGRK